MTSNNSGLQHIDGVYSLDKLVLMQIHYAEQMLAGGAHRQKSKNQQVFYVRTVSGVNDRIRRVRRRPTVTVL